MAQQTIFIEVQQGQYVVDAEPVVLTLKEAGTFYPQQLKGYIPEPPPEPMGERPRDDAAPRTNVKTWEQYDREVEDYKARLAEIGDTIPLKRVHGRCKALGVGFYAATGTDLTHRHIIIGGAVDASVTMSPAYGSLDDVKAAEKALAGKKPEKAGKP